MSSRSNSANTKKTDPVKIGLTVLGAGALGSAFLNEIVRPFYASQIDHDGRKDELHIRLIDYDVVEERNLISQNFLVSDIGKYKAEALAERFNGPGVTIEPCLTKLDDSNWPELILKPSDYDAAVCVDVGDNPRVRMTMSDVGQFYTPCLHASLSIGQSGAIRWSTPNKTTFHLNRNIMSVEEVFSAIDNKSETLLPCRLAETRYAIVLTGQVAAFALLHALGLDRTKLFRNLEFTNEEGHKIKLQNCVSLSLRNFEISFEEDFMYPLYKAPDTIATVIESIDTELIEANKNRILVDK